MPTPYLHDLRYPHTVYIGLGANLGDPAQQITQALKAISCLPQTRLLKASSFYKTKPWGKEDQPDFCNAVACIATALAPHLLLSLLLLIEARLGRVRAEHWGARTIDLDLLIYDELMLDETRFGWRLQLPHPYLWQREFVILPLAEIAPHLQFQSLTIVKKK